MTSGERDNSLNQTKKLLQQKIEHHRELIRISEETYNRIAEIETTKLNKHYENMDILAENMLDNLKIHIAINGTKLLMY